MASVWSLLLILFSLSLSCCLKHRYGALATILDHTLELYGAWVLEDFVKQGCCSSPGLITSSFFKMYLFIYIFGCVGSLLLCAGFSLVVASGGCSSLRCAGFSLGGFSWCGARALGVRASVVVALGLSSCGSQALEHRLSRCGARA